MTEVSGVYIGTSGWSYPKGEGTWTGYFYPAGKIDELSYFSRYFNAVEINTSFYSPINPVFATKWVNRVPENFIFTVKLWQKFTHPLMFQSKTGEYAAISNRDVELFDQGIRPLIQAGKLGALLAQFPPSFRNDENGQKILKAIINCFNCYPLAIELRHRSWSDDANTAKLLTDSHVAWVSIDEPGFESCISPCVPVTSDIAYFRFHGRNRENWWKGNTETRYKYLYSRDEIRQLAERVSEAKSQTRTTFAFFNNHWQAYAPRNATDLKRSLGMEIQNPPERDLFGGEINPTLS